MNFLLSAFHPCTAWVLLSANLCLNFSTTTQLLASKKKPNMDPMIFPPTTRHLGQLSRVGVPQGVGVDESNVGTSDSRANAIWHLSAHVEAITSSWLMQELLEEGFWPEELWPSSYLQPNRLQCQEYSSLFGSRVQEHGGPDQEELAHLELNLHGRLAPQPACHGGHIDVGVNNFNVLNVVEDSNEQSRNDRMY